MKGGNEDEMLITWWCLGRDSNPQGLGPPDFESGAYTNFTTQAYGAGRGTRTLTSLGQQILSLQRLPVTPYPHDLIKE